MGEGATEGVKEGGNGERGEMNEIVYKPFTQQTWTDGQQHGVLLIYLSIPGSSFLILEVTWATVWRNGLRTKSQVSFRDGRGRERTGNPPRTPTSTGGSGEGGRLYRGAKWRTGEEKREHGQDNRKVRNSSLTSFPTIRESTVCPCYPAS